jgi:hypothetical protein
MSLHLFPLPPVAVAAAIVDRPRKTKKPAFEKGGLSL